MEKHYSIGVDIGGSHITCAVVDLENRTVLSETIIEQPVDNKSDGETIIKTWSQAISQSAQQFPPKSLRGIGFAMPGPFDYVNGICLIKGVPKYEKLYGTNIGKEISKNLDLPDYMNIRFMNDASSFAVGEAWAGKASESNRSMAITIGTGFGSAFIADSIPVVTGESVPDLGCVYYIDYKDGIADDYFSTRWFTRRYEEITGEKAEGVKEVSIAADRDSIIMNLFHEFGYNLGEFLAPWLNRFGAEVLVIGGNISRSYEKFGDSLRTGLNNQGCPTEPFISELKENAALLGSGYLLEQDFWSKVQKTLPHM